MIALALALSLWFLSDEGTGTLTRIGIEGDPMEWILRTDGSQYPWVTQKYAWGGGYMDCDGKTFSWGGVPSEGPVKVSVERSLCGGDIIETYVFRNDSPEAVRLDNIGIYTPFNDNYPDAATCMTGRCNAHIWPGGTGAWVCAMRMGGTAPHLGLMVTQGAITDYEIWERGNDKGWSNDRGVIALCPPDMTLAPGQEYRLSWRLFAHKGTDFERQLLAREGTWASSPAYVYEVGSECTVTFRKGSRRTVQRRKLQRPGEYVFSHDGTFACVLAVPDPEELIAARVRFILVHQQMLSKDDPRYGAYMVYDNESGCIVTDDQGRSDLDEGRERVGMGILLAQWCKTHPSEELLGSLKLYAAFVRSRLQKVDFTTTSSVSHPVPDRGYNYPWIADFWLRMWELTGEKKYAEYAYGTLKALFRRFGYGFYCIDYPVTRALRVFEEAGMDYQRKSIFEDFRSTAAVFRSNGLSFPSHEVNYEQSIVAPAVQFLCEMSLAETDDDLAKADLEAAESMLPALEAFCGPQPSHRMNGISIRHWDGWWFGKTQTYGDVFPHYWSVITATASYYYALASGKREYMAKARRITSGNLSIFSPDGSASCASLAPRRVDGREGHYSDAYANDQDWALVAYLLVHPGKDLNARADEEYRQPIRKGEPYWNVFAKKFLYAPAFGFGKVEGADSYEYTLIQQGRPVASFTAPSPDEDLGSVWSGIEPGPCTLRVVARDASGDSLALAGTRDFIRDFPFRVDSVGPVKSYRQTALDALKFIHNMPSTRNWQTSQVPDMSYPFNSYVCKIVGATVRIECLVAREIPQLRQEALKAALGAGNYMVSCIQGEGTPLQGWPPTYGEAPEDSSTHVARVTQNNGPKMMVLEASVAGEAFLDLFDATADSVWLSRSLEVARTYGRIQGEDGSWPIRVDMATGASLSHFRLWPAHILKYLRRLETQYGIFEFAPVRSRAERYIREEALPLFDLSGMFEDSLWDDFPSYSNLTNFTASPYAAYLLTNPHPSEEDVRNACDLIRLSEDQFVHWGKFEGVNAFPPYVCEQYFYEEPIDSSIADVCDGYLSLYEYGGDPLVLAKAEALLNSLTRFQEPSGRILTLMIDFGDSEPGIEELWLNSTWWTSTQLLRLDSIIGK